MYVYWRVGLEFLWFSFWFLCWLLYNISLYESPRGGCGQSGCVGSRTYTTRGAIGEVSGCRDTSLEGTIRLSYGPDLHECSGLLNHPI